MLASNKSMLVFGICCVVMLSFCSMPAVAVALKADEKQSQPVENKVAQLKGEAASTSSEAQEDSKKTKPTKSNRTHFGMGFDQRNRSRGSSMGGSRQQGKGRGR